MPIVADLPRSTMYAHITLICRAPATIHGLHLPKEWRTQPAGHVLRNTRREITRNPDIQRAVSSLSTPAEPCTVDLTISTQPSNCFDGGIAY